ncbi:MAG: ethanolamine ammonia-lyase large subunit [Solirubrobacteraceae bacterium]|nr:ethanolamine ammonia-lyase large subunit [Solirubrobacteraceae bacterium]
MRRLADLQDIPVPDPRPDEEYRLDLLGHETRFTGLKALLGAADVPKAGERLAGLEAHGEIEREAARTILSALTLRHLYDRPLTDANGRVDVVMRVNYDVDQAVRAELEDLTVGELKERLLRCPPAGARRIGAGLTGVMAAAVAKVMDVHELILVARKLKRPTKARTEIGRAGTLSSRLQPNHPTDDLDAVALLVHQGLSIGAGDCLIGVNPAIDTAENVTRLLEHIDRLRRDAGAPTQICVLSHVRTQLACLERGAPVEIMFQSLAGTERTLTEEFDVTVELLDRAAQAMASRGPLRDEADHVMYFETGQGSELTYDKHDGIDMTTCEALCYGLARRYDPFMVNNVTGFIGPETHRDDMEMVLSNLQDHFMGKLLGLPMGMAPCYTLHADITMEGHQIATQLLTAAGANYFMDVHLTIDRMLAYFDTSGHDDQTLREVHGLEPAPAYLDWAVERGIFERDETGAVVRGPRWGDVGQFGADVERRAERLPAAYGFENAGPRPADAVSRALRASLAVAREAIRADLDADRLGDVAFHRIASAAPDRATHLADPAAGSRLAPESLATLEAGDDDVAIVVSDGLSAEAVHHAVPELLPVLLDGLAGGGARVAAPLLLHRGRVKAAERVADALACRLVVMLIGERPGGDENASRSMSAYLVLRLSGEERSRAAAFSGNADVRFEYSVISNIHAGGLPPLEAGGVIARQALDILHQGAAGNRLAAEMR